MHRLAIMRVPLRLVALAKHRSGVQQAGWLRQGGDSLASQDLRADKASSIALRCISGLKVF